MIEIKPLHHCDAVITIPGSKSYTHRALITSALADGESILMNALQSGDTEHTARALEQFGVPVFWGTDRVRVLGQGGKLKAGEETVFLGNSGTSMRFLTTLATLRNGRTLLDGSERMRKRPIADLLESLRALGVRTYSKEEDGYPPVIVESERLRGGTARIKGEESSQFLSGLLIVAPYALRDVWVKVVGNLVSKPYVDITRHVMSALVLKSRMMDINPFLFGQDRNIFLKYIGLKGMPPMPRISFQGQRSLRGR
jgi:3-phosphoshikimate 1-carboxyvinyltransferase